MARARAVPLSTAWQKQAKCALNEQERGDKAERRGLAPENLEDKDLVSLDGVEVVIQGEEDLRERRRG